MANVVVEEGLFHRMRHGATKRLAEWNARRPEGEAEAIEVYKQGNTKDGLFGMFGAQVPLLYPVVAGAAIYAIVTSEGFEKIAFLKKHWLLKPLLAFWLGYYLFRKKSPWAQAGLAASAILFVKGWKERPSTVKEAAGPDYEDAGRWEWDRREDAGALPLEQRGRALGEGRAERNAERLADRIFEHARAA